MFGLTSAIMLKGQGGVLSALAVAVISGAQWTIVTLVTLPAMLLPFAGWLAFSLAAPRLISSRPIFITLQLLLAAPVVLARFTFEGHSIESLRLGELFNAYYLRTWVTIAASIIGPCLLIPSIRHCLIPSPRGIP
jgi:hypothetical protein